MRVAIIGSGLAGLSCGCELVEHGHRVTLFEQRPWPGGKTYSFVDAETGEMIDNGQHVFMTCTEAYIAFLRRLGTLHLTTRQRRLHVTVIDAQGRRSTLAAAPLPARLHLLPSFALYRHLPLVDRLRIVRGSAAMLRVRETDQHALEAQTFFAWLRAQGQPERVIHEFWDLIVVAALNCRSNEASAAQALFVFREGFLRSATAAAIGVPRVGLSRLHVEPAVRYIERRGGAVQVRCAVERLEGDERGIQGVALSGGEALTFDAYVVAAPPAQSLSLLPPTLRSAQPFSSLKDFRPSPIVNVHLWFDGPVADFDFAAFVGSDLQWVFNAGRIAGGQGPESHLVLSLSAAGAYLPLGKEELVTLLLPQLARALPSVARRRLVRSTVIKEPHATFVAAPGLCRPSVETTVPNLFLAGSHTESAWPATMEAAVRSGVDAARAVSRMAVRAGTPELVA